MNFKSISMWFVILSALLVLNSAWAVKSTIYLNDETTITGEIIKEYKSESMRRVCEDFRALLPLAKSCSTVLSCCGGNSGLSEHL